MLAGLIPTDAHPGVGLAGVILPERGHSVSLVHIEADLQAPRLPRQPENRGRDFRGSPAPPFLSTPPVPESSLSRGTGALL